MSTQSHISHTHSFSIWVLYSQIHCQGEARMVQPKASVRVVGERQHVETNLLLLSKSNVNIWKHFKKFLASKINKNFITVHRAVMLLTLEITCTTASVLGSFIHTDFNVYLKQEILVNPSLKFNKYFPGLRVQDSHTHLAFYTSLHNVAPKMIIKKTLKCCLVEEGFNNNNNNNNHNNNCIVLSVLSTSTAGL